MKNISKKTISITVCCFVMLFAFLTIFSLLGVKNKTATVVSAGVEKTSLKQTKSVANEFGERLDSGQEYSSINCVIFSDISQNSTHAKNGITLNADFVLPKGQSVSWSLFMAHSDIDLLATKGCSDYLQISVNKNDTNKVNVKCLDNFYYSFTLTATFENEVKTFTIAFAQLITGCDIFVIEPDVSSERIDCFNSSTFNYGEMFLKESTVLRIYNVQYSDIGGFRDNGDERSVKLVMNNDAMNYLKKFVADKYGLRLVCLDGDFDNLIDLLKIEGPDNSLSNITGYPELIEKIKNYSGSVCSIDFSFETRSQKYVNTINVYFK